MSIRQSVFNEIKSNPKYLNGNFNELADKYGTSYGTIRNYACEYRQSISKEDKQAQRDQEQYGVPEISTDKKIEDFNWRDWVKPIQELQSLASKGSGGQDFATWKIKTDKEICVVVLGDTQLGSWATNYDQFMQITEDILTIPDLYVILVGDLLQTAIKMRGVLEVMDNLIPPKFQMKFLDSWLAEIKHKVIASTWDNHSVMRQEDAVGYSEYSEMFKRHTIYFGHIGHLDTQVGDITYKWAVSHFFTGKSLLNPLHAPMRYMRHEGQDRDIAAHGDFHKAGIMKYQEGMKERVAMVCGSIQTDSGYGKRFFSLRTTDNFPCVTLDPHTKMVTPYWSVKEWLTARKVKEQSKAA
jgi:hypothetical protein